MKPLVWLRIKEYEELHKQESIKHGVIVMACRVFQANLGNTHLTVIASFEMVNTSFGKVGKLHVSISNRTNSHPPRPARRPSREEIADFFEQYGKPVDNFDDTTDNTTPSHVVHFWEK